MCTFCVLRQLFRVGQAARSSVLGPRGERSAFCNSEWHLQCRFISEQGDLEGSLGFNGATIYRSLSWKDTLCPPQQNAIEPLEYRCFDCLALKTAETSASRRIVAIQCQFGISARCLVGWARFPVSGPKNIGTPNALPRPPTRNRGV